MLLSVLLLKNFSAQLTASLRAALTLRRKRNAFFTLVAISIILLITAGSIYLHLDTKQFVDNLPKPPQTEPTNYS